MKDLPKDPTWLLRRCGIWTRDPSDERRRIYQWATTLHNTLVTPTRIVRIDVSYTHVRSECALAIGATQRDRLDPRISATAHTTCPIGLLHSTDSWAYLATYIKWLLFLLLNRLKTWSHTYRKLQIANRQMCTNCTYSLVDFIVAQPPVGICNSLRILSAVERFHISCRNSAVDQPCVSTRSVLTYEGNSNAKWPAGGSATQTVEGRERHDCRVRVRIHDWRAL